MKICSTCGRNWPDDIKFCQDDGTALRAADAAAELVESVVADRYHIVSKIGEGGMGAVYLAQHVKMGRKCAVKVMSPSMAKDPDAIARFNREAANAARINHPNVCAIYDFGETGDGVIYLAMEYIEGESLTELLEREGTVHPARAVAIAKQVADALEAAHELGIVHRDLKPDNIMLTTARDGSDVVKVVDFGIAKAMGGQEGQKVTRTGLVVGTPEYMSPEQLSGDRLDGRSDIYSLGLVLFRTLTGVLPFQAETAQEVMIKRLTDEPLRLDAALPGAGFAARLQHVLDGALQRMPGERTRSAAAFGAEVVMALSEMDADAMAISDLEGATQLMTPSSAEPTGPVPATRVSHQDLPGEPVPPAPSRKGRGLLMGGGGLIAAGAAGVVLVIALNGGEPVATTDQPDRASAATQDTSAAPGPTGGASAEGSRRVRTGTDAGGRAGPASPPGPAGDRPPPQTATATSTVAGVPDHAALENAYFDLLDRFDDAAPDFPAIRASALGYYERNDVGDRDKADFAHVVAMTYLRTGRVDEAERWARLSLDHNPLHNGARVLLEGIPQ